MLCRALRIPAAGPLQTAQSVLAKLTRTTLLPPWTTGSRTGISGPRPWIEPTSYRLAAIWNCPLDFKSGYCRTFTARFRPLSPYPIPARAQVKYSEPISPATVRHKSPVPGTHVGESIAGSTPTISTKPSTITTLSSRAGLLPPARS